jgi:ketosteroid isomerase-like protein
MSNAIGISMKLFLVSVFFVLTARVFPQQVNGSDVASRDSANTGFGQIAERWLNGYNGSDAQALAPLYAEDAQYISGHVKGLVAQGREAVLSNFQRGMNMGGHLDGLEVLSINSSSDLATVLCKYFANNGGQKVSGRTLLILKKIHGKWLIVLHMTVV